MYGNIKYFENFIVFRVKFVGFYGKIEKFVLKRDKKFLENLFVFYIKIWIAFAEIKENEFCVKNRSKILNIWKIYSFFI